MLSEIIVFCFVILSAECKIRSRNYDIHKLQPNSDLQWVSGRDLKRMRRSIDGQLGHAVQPDNATLSTSEFLLYGQNDNEVFVFWTGPKNDTVMVLTRENKGQGIVSSTLWRSVDYGTTYSKVNLPDSALISHKYSSAANRSQTILSDVQNKRLYITDDVGESWSTVQLEFAPNRLLIHPSIQGYVLAYCLHKMTLYSSNDFGRTWTVLQNLVTERFFWAVPGVDIDLFTVHMEVQDPTGPVSYMACTVPNCVPVRFDNSLGSIDFFSLVVQDNYIFVQQTDGDSSSLYVSHKRGPFRKAYFPLDLHPIDFNVVETTDNQVFIAVDHEEDIANLYLSDVTGQFYVTSVENVVGMRYPGTFDVDLIQVEGLKGIYLVNKFMIHRNHGGTYQQKTFITFNKGGNWSLLTPPSDSNCSGVCNVQLHLRTTNQFFNIPLVRVEEEAPGLILAHGNVGEYLDLDTSIFISRDAGHTWKKAPFHGNHHLNILNQGSAITAIYAEGETSVVHFSWNEGETWQTHNFSDYSITVSGVLNEPGIKTLVASVFGHVNSSLGWSMVKLDFSSVLNRQCEHLDFELWYPAAVSQTGNDNCVLGEKLLYERRKQMSKCYYGNDYMRPKSRQPCLCTRQDFECDYGYNISDDGNTCVQADWFSGDVLPLPRCADGKFNQSIGYRKIPGDSCYDGIENQFSSISVVCPVIAPKGLKITAEKSYIATDHNVTFRLTQAYGSEQETEYTWVFGDGTQPVIIGGLDHAAVVVHSFSQSGSYTVSVHAKNEKGEATAAIPVYLEESIVGVLVEIPWGARTNLPSFFNVTVLGIHNMSNVDRNLHFAWVFENKVSGHVHQLRQLTWQNVIQQKFDKAGEYMLTLEVFNPVSSLVYTQPVEVYDNITSVRLHFSREINQYNTSNLHVRQALAEILCHNLAQILEVRRTRIIMTVQPYSPIVGDLSVLPARSNSSELDTDVVVNMLVEQARQQYLAFPLFTDDDVVIITDAHILNLTSGQEDDTFPGDLSNSTSSLTTNSSEATGSNEQVSSRTVVYIVVPVLMVSLVVIGLVIVFYRKKLCTFKRYSLIMRKSDDLIEDDDDEPVVIDPNFRSIFNRNTNMDSNQESEPTLVMVTEMPRNVDNQRLIEEC